MYSFRILPLLFVSLLAGCAATNDAGGSSGSTDDHVKIFAPDQYQKGQVVEIRVHNTSSTDTLTLYKPRNLVVQKEHNGQWKSIRTLYCPCGASCPAPPERVSITPGSSYTYRWGQKEQWCGEMNQQGIPEMHSRFPGTGRYRMAVRIAGGEESQIKTFYKAFTILQDGSHP